MIPDSGRGYLSKIFSDEWMADYGFLRVGGQSVADVLTRKRGALPALVHVHPEETVRAAISLMREYGVSQLPVVRAEPPLSAAEVMGSVSETQLLDLAFNDPSSIDRLVGDVAGPPLPTVGSGEEVDVAVEGLERAPAVLVLDSGHPVGILTRSDLLEFLAQRPSPS
jgi:cystathionine beta-synthase